MAEKKLKEKKRTLNKNFLYPIFLDKLRDKPYKKEK